MKASNFGLLIDQAVRLHPDKAALISGEQTWTYAELNDRMNKAGNLFKSFGVKRGDRVAVFFGNDLRFIEIIFGIMRIGAIPVPVNVKLGDDHLAYIIRDCGADAIVFHASFEEKKSRLYEAGLLKHYIGAGSTSLFPAHSYDELLADQPAGLAVAEVQAEDVCYLPYTSGSTGKPKGCMLTHGGQYWISEALRTVRKVSHEDRALIAVPLYHANAMVNIQMSLRAGASIVLLPGVDPKNILESVQTHGYTFMTGVPAMYQMILAYYKENPHYDLSSLRFILCGSSEVPLELVQELERNLRVDILESYGLTEGGPVVFSSSRGAHNRQGSPGHPLPGCQVRVVGEDGEDLPPGQVGELWVKSPGVAKGYWNLPEVNASRFTPDGWLKTGDLVRLDEEGYAYIAGRKDDMINIGGEKAYPKEIQNLLLKHPNIANVCVIARAHPVKGQVPVAFVVPTEDSELSAKDVQDYFFQHGSAYAYPREVYFLDELPLTGTGKVDRTKLTSLLNENDANAN